jgi:hypothetical protein
MRSLASKRGVPTAMGNRRHSISMKVGHNNVDLIANLKLDVGGKVFLHQEGASIGQ